MLEKNLPRFSKIGLGSVQFGLRYGISNSTGQTPPHEVERILEIAASHGIGLLDTASAYGNAEKVLGSYPVVKFQIVSKFRSAYDKPSLRAQLERSLADLRVTEIYGYLAHSPQDIISHPVLWDELSEFKKEGKILKRGFSLNRPDELKDLLQNGFMPDIVQVPYNYLDRRFEDSMKTLSHDGCEIHCRSAFLQGLFFTDPDGLSDFYAEVKPILKQLQLLGPSLSAGLLAFVMEKPFVDKVIIGVENSEQLKRNIQDAHTTTTLLPQLVESVSENILMPMNWPAR